MAPALRRAVLLRGIDTLIDIGANEGQYARWIRSIGFSGRIISFEPLSVPFRALSRKAAADGQWDCHQLAIGDRDAQVALHVARNSIGSSILTATVDHLRVVPDDCSVRKERARMRTLESLWPTLSCENRSVYLKIDVEGAELAVLRGANNILRHVAFLETELSLAPMFMGGPLPPEVVAFLTSRKFTVVALEHNGGDDRATGQTLMVDGIFRSRERCRTTAAVEDNDRVSPV